MKIVQSTLSIALLTIFLGGCSTFPSSDSECMKTVLVSTLSRVPVYPVMEKDKRSVTISTFKGGCGGSSADLPGGQDEIGINMTLTMPEATHGTHKVKKVAFPIFVALLDKDDNVLDRLDEKIEVTIDHHSLSHTHKITYRPPAGINVHSEDHRLLVGFNGSVTAVHSVNVQRSGVKKSTPKTVRSGKPKQKGAAQRKGKA